MQSSKNIFLSISLLASVAILIVTQFYVLGIFSFSILCLLGLIVLLYIRFFLRAEFTLFITSLLFTFILIEGSLYWIFQPEFSRPVEYNFSTNCFTKIHGLPYWHSQNSPCRATKYVQKQLVFKDRDYKTGSFGERQCSAHGKVYDTKLSIFGGSFAFGEGLNSEDTIACHIESALPHMKAFNYAVQGFGSAQMLNLLKYHKNSILVKNKQNIGLYFYIGDHIWRTVGSDKNYKDLKRFYRLTATRRLDEFNIHKMPKLYALSVAKIAVEATTVFGNIFLGRYAFNYASEADAVEITAQVISQAKDLFEQDNNDSFKVLFWPRETTDKLSRLLIARLRTFHIEVITPPQMPTEFGSPFLHPYDTHPSSAENEWLAKFAIQNLQKFVPEAKS